MALEFLSPIHKSSRQIGLYMEKRLRGHAVANTEGHVLTYLRAYAPCPVGELHDVFGYKRSTLTSLVDRLDARGLVAREPGSDDRRSVILVLTEKGARVADQINGEIKSLERSIRGRVRASDMEGFRAVMAAIEKATDVRIGGGKER